MDIHEFSSTLDRFKIRLAGYSEFVEFYEAMSQIAGNSPLAPLEKRAAWDTEILDTYNSSTTEDGYRMSKIPTIKLVREKFGAGLREAKEAVEHPVFLAAAGQRALDLLRQKLYSTNPMEDTVDHEDDDHGTFEVGISWWDD